MNGMTNLLAFPALGVWLLMPVALVLLTAYSAWTSSPLKLRHCWRMAKGLLVLSLAASALIGLLLVLQAMTGGTALTEAGLRFGLQPDGLSVWMAMLVSFIGVVILHYADRYLQGDHGHQRFLPWFLATLACVLLLVFTANLLVIAFAWVGSSLALHHLLTLYQDRPAARQAAFQKFLASRVGDVCVLAGVLLLYSHYQTFSLPQIYQLAGAGNASGAGLQLASVLFAIAALLKCAQIPFHGWLIRVMEAPTPVSALLHAGLINLGGFLWLRLYPGFEGFTPGHMLLILVGGASAVIAVLVMMTQTSVKHALAWSTCAQMGFMLFEIGLGAYTLALLHLMAHSLYKAHSFLGAGRTVAISETWSAPTGNGIPQVLMAAVTVAAAAGLLWLAPGMVEKNPVVGLLLLFAIASSVLTVPAGAGWRVVVLAGAGGLLLLPLYAGLTALLAPALPAPANISLPPTALAAGFGLLAVLVLASALIRFLPALAVTRWLRGHSANGFYLELAFDRLTARVHAAGQAGAYPRPGTSARTDLMEERG